MKRVISGKLYNTETATSLADNEFADGNNLLPHGRGSTLYKTKKGNYFSHHRTQWQGEKDTITPLSISEAKSLYESLPNINVEYEEAFGEAPEEA